MTFLLISTSVLVTFLLFMYYSHKQDVKAEKIINRSLEENIDIFSHYSVQSYNIENIKNVLVSEKILSLKAFQVNAYYDIKGKDFYTIDGGIEILTSKGLFSIGFSSEYEQYIFNNIPFTDF